MWMQGVHRILLARFCLSSIIYKWSANRSADVKGVMEALSFLTKMQKSKSSSEEYRIRAAINCNQTPPARIGFRFGGRKHCFQRLGNGPGAGTGGGYYPDLGKKTRECRLRQRPGECRLRRVSNQLRRVKAAFTAWNIAVVPLSVGGYPTFVGYVQPTSQRPTPSTAWWPPRASTVIFPLGRLGAMPLRAMSFEPK